MMKERRVFEGEDYETVDMETEIMGVGDSTTTTRLRSRSYGAAWARFSGRGGC